MHIAHQQRRHSIQHHLSIAGEQLHRAAMRAHHGAGGGEDRDHVGGTPKAIAPLTRLTPAGPTLIMPSLSEIDPWLILIEHRPKASVMSSPVSVIRLDSASVSVLCEIMIVSASSSTTNLWPFLETSTRTPAPCGLGRSPSAHQPPLQIGTSRFPPSNSIHTPEPTSGSMT